MPISEYFAGTYREARNKFLEAAHTAGAKLTHYTLPNLRGPENEELVLDVARLGPDNPAKILMLISATHGVEGFCGSGCQVGYLTDQLYNVLPANSGAILIHALNPFGFAWLRRVNEDNIDLNRNFQDFSKELPSSSSYEPLHNWLIPANWDGDDRRTADTALNNYIAKFGIKKFQAAVSGGQYSRPTGLFYGGTRESWSNRVFHEILGQHISPATKKIAVLDFHTGLGEPGFGEPIYLGTDEEGFKRARERYGDEVKSTEKGTSVSTVVTGSVADAFHGQSSHLEVTYLALEFGTQPSWEVLTALRADHWLHAVPNRVTGLRDGVKRQIRDAFYIDAPWWKAAVYGRSADFALRATRALGNS
jgi:predicted deacylase